MPRWLGPDGVRVEVISLVHKAGFHRTLYRLRKDGRWVGDYPSLEQLAKHVDLGTLVEQQEPPPAR